MEIGTVKPVNIEEEMKSSYLDYAMSVIVARALPDVRDGLKPVQRRILYSMEGLGLRHTGPYKKSARIVGEVLGKYHPHGDSAVYEAMVRLAQDFSMRYMLVDGQGNFGSIDNDPPAAMRYTEARMAAITAEMLADIDKETVDFTPNFDGSLQEPTVLPTRLSNLLVNGSAGIAVGMATNIPPHNLGEICDATCLLIDNPEATTEELNAVVLGPDFPSAGVILGREGIQNAYATGHGRIILQAKAIIENLIGGRSQIIVTELPYQVNKAALVERIAELAKAKRVEGISELRDESDREGMRIVIELKREAQPGQVLNNLYKHTAMRSSFSANMLALVDGQPRVLSLREALQHFIDFRHNVITRRSLFELEKTKQRAHILEGFKIALDNLDRIIALIRKSETVEAARTNLMQEFKLSQVQAQAILDMQLRRLAALERKKIEEEYAEALKTIAYLEDLLANPRKIFFLIKEEARELKAKYGDPRRTIISDEEMVDFSKEDLVPHQEMVVTLSQRGYIKRLPSDTYRLQRRGGKGVIGVRTREADIAHLLLVADTHDTLLFFSNRGKVFSLRCHDISLDTSRAAKGLPLINLVTMDTKELITAVVVVTDFEPGCYMVMATRSGEVKRVDLSEFASVRSNGLIAMDLEKDDELVGAGLATKNDEVMLVTRQGQAIRFASSDIRASFRTSGGVRGIRLSPGDSVVSMDVVSPQDYLLAITAQGLGKRTLVSSYPLQGRGGSGVRTFKIIPKTGEVAAARKVHPSQEIMVISAHGIVLRTWVRAIASLGRDTQGVIIMKMDEGDQVVAITIFDSKEKAGSSSQPAPA